MVVITHNISAINTQRNIQIASRSLSKSLEKLSSGYQINTGQDGPADLIISEQLRAQNAGLERAVRNTQESSNVLGIAEGALNEMNEILKKMRALAIHAANNGVTSPSQVAADQAEMDSGIQTIDRIANTTKYSDQFLLNGNKEIVYSRTTIIKGTQQNSLINTGQTDLNQIFKKSGYSINLAFSGTDSANATTGNGTANLNKETTKAYFEIDTGGAISGQVDSSGNLTGAQDFIISGELGSRSFKFDSGATLGQIAAAIHNVSDSTGVDASLIFSSSQGSSTFSAIRTGAASNSMLGGVSTGWGTDYVAVFGNDKTNGISAFGANVAVTSQVGKNTDGNGRIWIKWTSATNYELYKDESLSNESKIAHGVAGTAGIIEDNNSGFSHATFNLSVAGNPMLSKHSYFSMGGTVTPNNGVTTSGCFANGGANVFEKDYVRMSGVQLGKNTDSEGRIYLKVIQSANTVGQVFAYKDAAMRNEDMVAKSDANVNFLANSNILLNEIRTDDDTAGTGLGIAVYCNANWTNADTKTGTISFTSLGVRMSSTEYGDDAFVRVQQNTGSIWQYYSDKSDVNTKTMVDAGTSGITVEQRGQNATLSINGQQVQTDGLKLNVSTQDLQAEMAFNAGHVGSTTIAQVGYNEGTVFSGASLLTYTSVAGGGVSSTAAIAQNAAGYLVNCGHVTNEALDNFSSGMQFQLGEGQGDQERTVYALKSMSASNLGQVTFTDRFENSKAVIATKTLSLADVLGGGDADLAKAPVKALAIIDQAIADVSNLRAQIGATQGNLLQTNANSLSVAIENIQKTESTIRDTDMAAETAEFTKDQILNSAAIAMLAQANAGTQNVLQLLG